MYIIKSVCGSFVGIVWNAYASFGEIGIILSTLKQHLLILDFPPLLNQRQFSASCQAHAWLSLHYSFIAALENSCFLFAFVTKGSYSEKFSNLLVSNRTEIQSLVFSPQVQAELYWTQWVIYLQQRSKMRKISMIWRETRVLFLK